MSIYGKELDPLIEHRTQFTFKGKIEHIATVNTTNIAYPSQKFNIIIPPDSADHVIVPDTLKITFGLELTSRNKAPNVVNNFGRALVKKKVLKPGSKEIDAINSAFIYDIYKDFYLGEKEHEERLLQGLQLANGLKAQVRTKKTDGKALTLTTQENIIEKTYDKRFAIPLDDFFKHPVCPYGLKEDLIIMIELNSAKEVIIFTGDTIGVYQTLPQNMMLFLMIHMPQA